MRLIRFDLKNRVLEARDGALVPINEEIAAFCELLHVDKATVMDCEVYAGVS